LGFLIQLYAVEIFQEPEVWSWPQWLQAVSLAFFKLCFIYIELGFVEFSSVLTISLKLAARSLYGCWTCRVRKKKCDENRPSCSTCVSLKLMCYGYGDKPAWMDNGPLQREKALKFKQIVSQNNSKRRKQRMHHGPSSSLPSVGFLDMDILCEETSSASAAPSNYHSEELPSSGTSSGSGTRWSTEMVGDEAEIQTWSNLKSFDRDHFGASSQDNLFSTEWFSNNHSWENNMCVDNGFFSGYDAMPARTSGMSRDSEATLPLTLDFFDADYLGSSFQDNLFTRGWSSNDHSWENANFVDSGLSSGQDPMPVRPPGISQCSETTPKPKENASNLRRGSRQSAYGVPGEEMSLKVISAPLANLSSSSQPTAAQLLRTNKVVKRYPISSKYPEKSILREDKEDELFMHYLDKVFYIQYPFYNSRNTQSRLWLFSILRRVRSVYHATLALSERHIQSMVESSLQIQANKMNYYDMALRELELSIAECSRGTDSLIHNVEGSTCILQILFCEVSPHF